MKKVLIVEDDNDTACVIGEMLVGSFQTTFAASGREGLLAAGREKPALILLDLNLPDMSGFEVCRKLRVNPATAETPVIFLTSAASLDNCVQGLSLGADDFLPKPFQVKELLARIQARVRRRETEIQAASGISLGNLQVLPNSCEVRIEGRSVQLTQLELSLLRYFLAHPDQVISRERLLGDLWSDAVVVSRTVDTHVSNLRKKLRGVSYPIETVHRTGYVLRTSPPDAFAQLQEVCHGLFHKSS